MFIGLPPGTKPKRLVANQTLPIPATASEITVEARGSHVDSPTILRRLRNETSERHAALEQKLPLVNPSLSRDSYRSILEGFFGYYAPLEVKLGGSPGWAELGFDFSARRQVPQLEKDLVALGKTTEEVTQLPQCAELPELATIPQVLGCLYVIEGAKLGGQIITRHLHANLGITPETGGAFFVGYGAETGARWQAFGAMITAAVARLGGEDEIVANANRTFETLHHWLFPRASH
jgi:heme oxygenase (biliverdin-IX-beta and delta-forming)